MEYICTGLPGTDCKQDFDCVSELELMCMDWKQGNDSTGLKCGRKADCGKSFTYDNVKYDAQCDGLMGQECDSNEACD